MTILDAGLISQQPASDPIGKWMPLHRKKKRYVIISDVVVSDNGLSLRTLPAHFFLLGVGLT